MKASIMDFFLDQNEANTFDSERSQNRKKQALVFLKNKNQKM